jgi:Fic family protein
MTNYNPPFDFTHEIIDLVEKIGEELGQWSAFGMSDSPQLRRSNRIRTIQASLEIENNTLSVEQVTAVLDGKRVLGLPKEIKEVQNAFLAYEQMNQWQADNYEHLLAAHAVLMDGLLDMAPPANQVSRLMNDLLNWLKSEPIHPLIASCIFHYEFEFIHPFADGNGRMGRLWQTLILSNWKPILAYLPVETVIRDKQQVYYQALRDSDQAANSTIFVKFMLQVLLTAMEDVTPNNQQLSLF